MPCGHLGASRAEFAPCAARAQVNGERVPSDRQRAPAPRSLVRVGSVPELRSRSRRPLSAAAVTLRARQGKPLGARYAQMLVRISLDPRLTRHVSLMPSERCAGDARRPAPMVHREPRLGIALSPKGGPNWRPIEIRTPAVARGEDEIDTSPVCASAPAPCKKSLLSPRQPQGSQRLAAGQILKIF